jgi:hypothetical protein
MPPEVAEGMQPQAVAVNGFAAHSRLNAVLRKCPASARACLVFRGVSGLGVQLDVFLAGLACMLVRVNSMAVSDVGMVSRRFVIPFARMLGSSAVVLGSLFMMPGCFFVKFIQLFHDRSLVKY